MLEKAVAEELIGFKLRRLQELIDQILTRWYETDPETFLEKVRDGRHPNAENDAIELEQFLIESQQANELLKNLGQ